MNIHNAYGEVVIRVGTHSESTIPPIALDLRTGQATMYVYLRADEARAFAAELLEVAERVERAAVAA